MTKKINKTYAIECHGIDTLQEYVDEFVKHKKVVSVSVTVTEGPSDFLALIVYREKKNGQCVVCVSVVCNCVNHSNNDEVCWWLGVTAGGVSNYPGFYRWENSRRVVVRTIYPKIIRGYKAAPHKIVRNIDGEWYESRPTKEIWPAGSDVPDINGEYYGGYDCAYRWFPIGKDYPKGEWYEIKHNLYGWEMDFKPGQKPLSAYYWHTGEPEPTFHEYKHVDGIIKHVKTTYKKLPFQEVREDEN